jgi:RNA-directed DNA polymerase
MSEPRQKPYVISKKLVMEAWSKVKANQGAAGVDGESIADYEKKLKDNLYRLWNRMSSGSYFPPPVRTVEIPKAGGGERKLGIPTVGDRVAQMVVKMMLEPKVEPMFHADSYGYRPAKSAHDAVGRARQRCWRYDWVLDLDIKGFFDNIPHDLMMRAVRKHAPERWVVLYIERWLKAPAQDELGNLVAREKGTPQGGVISPLLANLFLHYGFDRWMKENHPETPFERYADDAIVHGRSLEQMQKVAGEIAQRLGQCGLELHPEKTKIVYCKDSDRRRNHEHEKFTFLGYEFRPRLAKNHWGKHFVNFLPAVSEKAIKAIREEIRTWKLHLRSDKSLEDLSRMFNPIVRGWVQYYGKFYRSMLYRLFAPMERALVRWACRKFKKLRDHHRRAKHWLRRVSFRSPKLFAHWQIGIRRNVPSMGAV